MNYNIAAAWIAQVYKIPWDVVAQQNPRPNQHQPEQPPEPESANLRAI